MIENTEWQEMRYNTGYSRFNSFYAGRDEQGNSPGSGVEWRVKNGDLQIRGRCQKSSNIALGDVMGFLDGLYFPISGNIPLYLSSGGMAFCAIDSVIKGGSLTAVQVRVITIIGTTSTSCLLAGTTIPVL